jgi:hypothetical protein
MRREPKSGLFDEDASEGEPATDVELGEAVKKVSKGIDRLGKSGLNRDAILVLLSHSTKIGYRTCAKVLDGLAALEKKYTK